MKKTLKKLDAFIALFLFVDTRRDGNAQKTSLEESSNLVHLYPPQSTSGTNSIK